MASYSSVYKVIQLYDQLFICLQTHLTFCLAIYQITQSFSDMSSNSTVYKVIQLYVSLPISQHFVWQYISLKSNQVLLQSFNSYLSDTITAFSWTKRSYLFMLFSFFFYSVLEIPNNVSIPLTYLPFRQSVFPIRTVERL